MVNTVDPIKHQTSSMIAQGLSVRIVEGSHYLQIWSSMESWSYFSTWGFYFPRKFGEIVLWDPYFLGEISENPVEYSG